MRRLPRLLPRLPRLPRRLPGLSALVLLAALAAPVLPTAEQSIAAPGVVAAAGSRLVRPDGASFFLLGVNYVGGPDRSWTMWQDGKFDPGAVEQDFLKAKAAGLNTVRLFVRSPLQQEIAANRWSKLDAVVELAERHGLYLIVTLYDYSELSLAKVAATGRAIAQRYANRPAILAYDLKNEPHFQDIALAQYPGSPPPLQTDALIKHYGERLKPGEVAAWRQTDEGKRLLPARLDDQQAYRHANNHRLYLEFLEDAGNWVAARNYDVTTLDYIESPDSARWQPLLQALDQTLAAWLQPQVDALRAGDPRRLITVGYSDAVLAGLPANHTLGFVSIHRFPNAGLKPLRVAFDLLEDVRRAHPGKPVVFEEYGYSTAEAAPGVTALYETAVALQLIGQGFAGGAKWSLHDVAEGSNPREMSFGLYQTDGNPKPAVAALRALGEYVANGAPPAGKLDLAAEPGGPGLRYVYSAPDALFVAGPTYADPAGRLGFTAPAPTQVFVAWPHPNRIDVISTGPATLRLNPSALLGSRSVRDLVLERADGTAIAFQREGETIAFEAAAGQTYRLRYTSLETDARIEIVWPHAGKPVREADRANVTAYLFERGQTSAVCPELAPTVVLWRALNNGVEEPVSVGQRRGLSAGGLSFSAWDFNDLDVSAARDPRNKYYFRTAVEGYPSRSSIWSHGEDARTYLPNPDVPSGVAADAPADVDAKIQIVWPHGNLPVDQATKANVVAYLFQRGTLVSAPAGWSPTVRLWRSLNNGYEEEVAVGQKVTRSAGGLTFPAWEFNDVDVSAARDRLNKYYFRVTVDGVDSRSNVWSHGADARTHFPQQDVPTAVGACR